MKRKNRVQNKSHILKKRNQIRKKYINNSLHLALQYARMFARDVICSEKRTVFREHSWSKTVSFEEQIMSKDKYANMFSPQLEAIMLIILQIFIAARAVLKNWEYHSDIPQFLLENIQSRDSFRPIARERKHLLDYNTNYNPSIRLIPGNIREKDLKNKKHNGLHLGRKYARIFVLGHNLFLKAHSFPPATLSENSLLLGPYNVREQISQHLFAANGGYCLYIMKYAANIAS